MNRMGRNRNMKIKYPVNPVDPVRESSLEGGNLIALEQVGEKL